MSAPEGLGKSARATLAGRGLLPKKSWGQNFLHDRRVLQRIASAVGAPGDGWIVELGAGLGALTQALLHDGHQVVAVERDRDLVPTLKEAEKEVAGRLVVHEGDALKLDYEAMRQRYAPRGLRVAGNLPYQIASRLLVHLADARGAVTCAVVMVQREVAVRMASAAGSKDYGLLSVLVQRAFAPEILFDVPAAAFFPRPRVASSVVRLTERTGQSFSAEEDALLCHTARMSFSARRKMLRRAILQSGQLAARATLADVSAALVGAGVEPEQRAETLTLDAFLRVGLALKERGLMETGHA